MRRFQYYRSTVRSGVSTANILFKQIAMYKIPPFYGYNNNGWDVAKGLIVPASNFNFNQCAMTYVHWIVPAYIGQRGSINYSLVQDAQFVTCQFVARQPNASLVKCTDSDIASVAGTACVQTAFMRDTALVGASSAGIMASSNFTLGATTWQFPNYSSYKFNVSTPTNFTASIGQDDTDAQSQIILMGAPKQPSSNATHWFLATGTDFTPLFFLNVPTVFVYSGTPVPV